MQRLIVSVRGLNEAIGAEGGAHIAYIECPESALDTPCQPRIMWLSDYTNPMRFVRCR
jgi:hypothetical protein